MKISAYNIFPPLLGHIKNWYAHVDRVKNMGFEWIYLNPLTYPGFSGSLYAAKDYYLYNKNFFTNETKDIAEKEIKSFINYCKEKNIKVMVDLVINHSSKDSELTKTHIEWYKTKDGNLVSPGAWDDGKWVEWGDLASFDNEKKENEKSEDNALWQYWKKLIEHNIELGFSGFRCDAAYKVPKDLWVYLINSAKNNKKDVVFFAESLGCSKEDIATLSNSGFDYVASSAKWWDYEGEWFIEQYDISREKSKQIAFPENHDTLRLITEYSGNIWKVKQRAFFTAIVCDMWMITLGFEYGFKNRCYVVGGNTTQYENINYDISEYIKKLNSYVKENDILSSSGKIESLDIEEIKELKKKFEEEQKLIKDNELREKYLKENDPKNIKTKDPFRKFYKYSLDETKKLLIVINIKDETSILDAAKYNIIKDISFDNIKENLNNLIEFLPYEVKVFSLEV